MWIWPVQKFWTFTPFGWCLAIIWNICEFIGVSMPFAPYAFGLIIGRRPRRRTNHAKAKPLR